MSKRSGFENEFFYKAPNLTDSMSKKPRINISDNFDDSKIYTSTHKNPYIIPPSYVEDNSKKCSNCNSPVNDTEDMFCPYCGNMLD